MSPEELRVLRFWEKCITEIKSVIQKVDLETVVAKVRRDEAAFVAGVGSVPCT